MTSDGETGGRRFVALVACPSYEPKTVGAALERGLRLLEEAGEEPIPEGCRALVKPNLLLGVKPARAVTTHPAIVRAVLGQITDRGGTALLGDNPMFDSPRSALRRCGFKPLLEELDVEVAEMEFTTVIQAPARCKFKRFEVSKVIDEVDLLVNVCKLKTHGISGLSLAIKNLFGTIPGLEKSSWHMKAPSHEALSAMLVDLYEALLLNAQESGRRWLHVADAVIGLEGEGPGPAGRPKEVGAIAMSTDGLALDEVLTRLVRMAPEAVTTTRIARARGLGRGPIEVLGDGLEALSTDFAPCRGSLLATTPPPSGGIFASRFIRDRLVERPEIRLDLCTGCGDCAKVCAAEAITLSGKPKRASIDHDRCIRCSCCSEACRYEAARLGPRPLLARAADHRHQLPWLGAGLLALGALAASWIIWG